MSLPKAHPAGPEPEPRWFHPTPDRLVPILLTVEALLWLSDRLGWPAWPKGYAVLAAVASVGTALLLMLLWFMISLGSRWRFQFGIRSLLVLAVAVALPCNWLAVEMRRAETQREAVEAVRRAGNPDAGAGYDYMHGFAPPCPSVPQWLRDLFGDDFFCHVVIVAVNSDDQAQYLPPFSHLKEAYLYDRVTDAGVVHLQSASELRTLHLRSDRITDAGLLSLQNLPQLHTLSLTGRGITEAGFACLEAVPTLETLTVRHPQLSEAGLAHLQRLPRLHVLEVLDATGADLVRLAGLPQLEKLVLNDPRLEDAGLAEMQGLHQIKRLELNCNWRDEELKAITDAGLAHLERLMQLEELVLHGVPVTDAGLAHLCVLRRLKQLELADYAAEDENGNPKPTITDAGFERLAALEQLEVLRLPGAKIGDAGLAHLRALTVLQSLDISDAPITDAGLKHLAELKNLEELDVCGTGITGGGLSYLTKLGKLKSLQCDDTLVARYPAAVSGFQKALPRCGVNNKGGGMF